VRGRNGNVTIEAQMGKTLQLKRKKGVGEKKTGLKQKRRI